MRDRHPALRPLHRARRHRPLRGALALPGAEGALRWPTSRARAHRQRACSRWWPTPLRGRARARRDPRARRHRHATRCSTTSACSAGSARAHETSKWTTSVCTGSLLLGAAGILDGLEATSTGSTRDARAARRPPDQPPRGGAGQGDHRRRSVVGDRHGSRCWPRRSPARSSRRRSSSGIEYDPEPPFDAGSVEKAPPEIVALIRGLAAARTV